MSIFGDSLNELTYNTCFEILNDGVDIPSRNGASKELCDEELFLNNPQARHLYLEGRTNNIYGTLGEVFWLLAGKTEISPVLEKFVPRAANYSDDGKNWRAGYGERLYEHDQINHVVQMFLKDGKNTRRAVMSVWQPQKDTIKAVQAQGFQDSKDYPCSNFLWFWIREDKFYCKLGMRSNDWIFGGSNINVVEFTILQELILALLKTADPKQFEQVELGYYHHSVISLHLYDATIKQAQDIVANRFVNEQRFQPEKTFPISLGELTYRDMRPFFNDLYQTFWHEAMNSECCDSIHDVFRSWEVPTHNNQLFCYAMLAQAYLEHLNKKKINFEPIKNQLSSDLLLAVKHNKFTPKDWLT